MIPALSDLLTTDELREPAKRWRNWWLYPTGQRFADNSFARPGVPNAGEILWPSREVAEQKALDSIKQHEAEAHRYRITSVRIYLGALPEGERP